MILLKTKSSNLYNETPKISVNKAILNHIQHKIVISIPKPERNQLRQALQ